jgi:hypothetical protein
VPSSAPRPRREIEAKVGGKPIPSLSSDAVMSILVSRADMKIYVLQNADIVAEGAATIKDPTVPIGSNVFVWQGGDAKGSTWDGMGFHADPTVPMAPNTNVLQRIDGAPDVMYVIRDRIKPARFWSPPTRRQHPIRAAAATLR